jgi:peptide/nickel transport system permease protein
VPGVAVYILRRLLLLPVILFVVSVVAFSLGRFAPSDYVEIYAGGKSRPEILERVRTERGLNDPVYEQYGGWLANVLQGDLGKPGLQRRRSAT